MKKKLWMSKKAEKGAFGVVGGTKNVDEEEEEPVKQKKPQQTKVIESPKQPTKQAPPKLNRRFIVVEGIYQNHGDICPLNVVVELKNRYKYRLILDDTFGVGVLGATGKGTHEHFNVPVSEIEFLSASMDAGLGTVGGYCVGRHEVITHQRLHGLGYCFSASAPPYTCTAGILNLAYISSPRSSKVRANATALRQALNNIPNVVVEGSNNAENLLSPIIHLKLDHHGQPKGNREEDETILQQIVDELLAESVITYVPEYVPCEREKPWPSLRLFVTNQHTASDIETVAKLLTTAFSRVSFSSSPVLPNGRGLEEEEIDLISSETDSVARKRESRAKQRAGRETREEEKKGKTTKQTS